MKSHTPRLLVHLTTCSVCCLPLRQSPVPPAFCKILFHWNLPSQAVLLFLSLASCLNSVPSFQMITQSIEGSAAYLLGDATILLLFLILFLKCAELAPEKQMLLPFKAVHWSFAVRPFYITQFSDFPPPVNLNS